MSVSLPSPRAVWRSWGVALMLTLALSYRADPDWWLPAAPSRLVHSADRFFIPTVHSESLGSDAAIVRQAALWGAQNVKVASATAEVDPWSFSGTYLQGKNWVAIVVWKSGKKPSQELQAGDVTPDGGKIIEVAEDRMLVQVGTLKNKRPKTLWILLHQAGSATS